MIVRFFLRNNFYVLTIVGKVCVAQHTHRFTIITFLHHFYAATHIQTQFSRAHAQIEKNKLSIENVFGIATNAFHQMDIIRRDVTPRMSTILLQQLVSE